MDWWLRECYYKNKFECWMMGCPDEETFVRSFLRKPPTGVFVQDVINHIFANSAQWAFFYIFFILQDRWPVGEKAIAKSALYSYEFAKCVIMGPWPPGEAAIAIHPLWACNYVCDILKTPWPPGEAAIAREGELSYFYAVQMGQRFPLGEPMIAKEPRCKPLYEKRFGISLD